MNSLQTFIYQGSPIDFDLIDGQVYANATAMCRPFGKEVRMWSRLESTTRYVNGLRNRAENAQLKLGFTREGRNGGTWIHEKLILKLAQWLDVDFEIWCDEQIAELLRTGSCELAPSPCLPQTHAEALRALADEIEAREAAEQKLLDAGPKLDHYERVMNAEGFYSINSVAKMIGTGEVRLFRFLRDQKILFHDGQYNKPYQAYLELGWFVVKQNTVHVGGKDRVYVQTYATQHGIEAIRRKWEAQTNPTLA